MCRSNLHTETNEWKCEGKNYLDYIDLQQVYEMINWEALWQVLMIFGGGKLLNGVKSVYIQHLAAHIAKILSYKWQYKEL